MMFRSIPWTFASTLALAAIAGADGAVRELGTACAGHSGIVPDLDVPLVSHTGQIFWLDVTGPPNTAGVVAVGTSDTFFGALPLPLDLAAIGMSGCQLLVSIDLQIPFATDQNGAFRFQTLGFLPGIEVYAQAYLADIGPGKLGGITQGVHVTSSAGPAPGDVVITEIMQNPAFVADADGEWFEVRNALGRGIDMNGWRIRDDQGSHQIQNGGPLVLPADGYLVFGRKKNLANNGGIPVDYRFFDDIKLGNQSDSLALRQGGIDIDHVAWDDGATFPDPNGRSMSLDPAHWDAVANDAGQAWCAATTAIVGSTDRGTPGQPNPACGD